MAIEIERKFLVRDDSWRAQSESDSRIVQGYLSTDARLTLRARLRGEQAFLTLKGPTRGVARSEFEYPIPPEDAETMLAEFAQSALIEKRRYLVREQGWLWEVDEFAGDNHGLVLAEIELPDVAQEFPRPVWLGEEVSHDPRYFNSSLARHPFARW
ncbi:MULTISPECIES: CYTH domain-containing protein [Thiorhodovibrio]|uniref:CYTH domain-containing protein n=1 Tax=Thiorhodovibrio TaxID=61593 RepID=UPI001912EE22|nr:MULTISPECIES: CYTH domain-containing protein [Thiorhodovibrio]MBK5968562.1 adenylate cyclase [Thiorhodovibrio winogradskyi]WPL11341.1 CYTH domain protein [Thiorhodovibrio litoralis]